MPLELPVEIERISIKYLIATTLFLRCLNPKADQSATHHFPPFYFYNRCCCIKDTFVAKWKQIVSSFQPITTKMVEMGGVSSVAI